MRIKSKENDHLLPLRYAMEYDLHMESANVGTKGAPIFERIRRSRSPGC